MAQKLQINTNTWTDLKNKVVANAAVRRDYRVRWGDLSVNAVTPSGEDDTGQPFQAEATFLGDSKLRQMMMRDRAYGQFLGRLQISHANVRDFSPEIQNAMIAERSSRPDYMIDIDPATELFIRTRPGIVRAILSGRYGDVPDVSIAEQIDAQLPRLDDYRVLRGRASDDVFQVTLIGRERVEFNGDHFYPIHKIFNSETGCRSFEVSSGICKGACSNGMIFNYRQTKQHRIRHLGRNVAANVQAALADALSITSDWSERVLPGMKRSLETTFNLEDDRDLKRLVSRIRQRTTKKFALETIELAATMPEDIYGDEFPQGTVVSLWAIVNAMTHLAQDMDELDRHATEVSAGQLLATSV